MSSGEAKTEIILTFTQDSTHHSVPQATVTMSRLTFTAGQFVKLMNPKTALQLIIKL